MTQSPSLPAGDAFRARVILILADGLAYRIYTTATRHDRADDLAWERALRAGARGRPAGEPTSWPEAIRDYTALQAKVLDATRRKPKGGSAHWSCRKLAAQLGISKDTCSAS